MLRLYPANNHKTADFLRDLGLICALLALGGCLVSPSAARAQSSAATAPTCAAGTTLTDSMVNGVLQFSCVATAATSASAVPTCPAGEVLTDSVTSKGIQFSCVAAPAATNVPNCPAGSVLSDTYSSSGLTLYCMDSTNTQGSSQDALGQQIASNNASLQSDASQLATATQQADALYASIANEGINCSAVTSGMGGRFGYGYSQSAYNQCTQLSAANTKIANLQAAITKLNSQQQALSSQQQ